jgi:hypothetical protein
VKWPLVKILDFPDAKAAFKRKVKIFPALPFEILEGSLGKKGYMRGILIGLDRSVVRNVDVDLSPWLADPVNLLEKLNQILNMLKEVPAEDLIDRIVQKGQTVFRIANEVDSFTSDTVDADVAGAFDTTRPQIDLNGAILRSL